jgi:uncharacterized membrane protein YphA (DoxX/SURF4 family)
MKYVYLVCRILLGLGFVLSGAGKLFPFMHAPAPVPGTAAAALMAAMVPTGWMKVVGLAELFGGLFVLYGGTVPLGLVLLAPVTVNILAVNILIMGGGGGLIAGLVCTVLELALFYAYRASFAGILTYRATSTT